MLTGQKLGGRGEIRTHGPLRIVGFQDRCIKPLCHFSFYIHIETHSRPPIGLFIALVKLLRCVARLQSYNCQQPMISVFLYGGSTGNRTQTKGLKVPCADPLHHTPMAPLERFKLPTFSFEARHSVH